MINTMQYYPEHIQRMKEFIRMTVGIDAELEKVWDAMGSIEQSMYIDTMDTAACARWEKFIGITKKPDDTVVERRRRIKGYFASDLPYTVNKLKESLNSMFTENGYELEVKSDERKVVIQIKLAGKGLHENAEEIARNMVPCDMFVVVSIIYNMHYMFKDMTQGQMEEYTHYRLRNDPVFQEDMA